MRRSTLRDQTEGSRAATPSLDGACPSDDCLVRGGKEAQWPLRPARSEDFRLWAGPGKLVVADTRLSGGGKGVQCRGTGALHGVRAIYGAGMPLFFFEVDSR